MTISTPVIVVAFLIGMALWYGDFASKREQAAKEAQELFYKEQAKAQRRQEKLMRDLAKLQQPKELDQ